MTSYANMHWPGLYSIVLGKNAEGGLSRVFLAKPGRLHEDLRDRNRPFLHHAHAYDFKSTTIAGAVENDVFIAGDFGVARIEDHELFYAYRYEREETDLPKLELTNSRNLSLAYTTLCLPGELYELKHHAIHRVVFHPDPRTGWFCVRIDEGSPKPRPELCYSKHFMFDIPHSEFELYRPMEDAEVKDVLGRFREYQGSKMPKGALEVP